MAALNETLARAIADVDAMDVPEAVDELMGAPLDEWLATVRASTGKAVLHRWRELLLELELQQSLPEGAPEFTGT